MENQNEEQGLDLLGLLLYLKKKVVLIGIVAAVFAVIGLLGTAIFIAPEYTASTRIYVLNKQNEDKVVTSDYQIANYMISDYTVLITGRNVTKEVISTLELDLTTKELSEMIQVTAPDNTRILQISVTDTDPQRAADIANSVRQIASEQIKDIMDVDAVNLVYTAETPSKPSGPSLIKNTLIVMILGVAAVVGVLAVIFVLDDAIHTEEDVQRYLGLGTLGVIPVSTELSAGQDKPAPKGKFAQIGMWAKK